MKILYSFPHPADRLQEERAGHVIRANALLAALEQEGHEVIRVQAASAVGRSSVAVAGYRSVVKRLIPHAIALRLRDAGRVAYGKVFANQLCEAVSREQPDIILETHVGFSLAGSLASVRTRVPLVVDDIAPALEEETEFGDGLGLKRTAEIVYSRVVEQASVLVAVSDEIHNYLARRGVPETKIALIQNGYDAAAFHPGVDGSVRRRELAFEDDQAPLFVFVGSFLAFHRVELLVDSFIVLNAALPANMLFVGDGPDVSQLKAKVRDAGLARRARFVGRVPHSDVPAYVAAADIAVLPGALDFGNPMKLLEYFALAMPTIAPNLAAVSRLASDGREMVLFENGSADSLRAAMEKLASDNELCVRLGTGARRLSLGHTWRMRARQLCEVLAAKDLVPEDPLRAS